jgi:predicted acylesterase/phospholipase RssA
MTPQKVQLAIQGGGAKIVDLMATLEAIEELEKEGRLKVTKIAGTSAGSIVGAFFAAKIPMDTIRTNLREGGGKNYSVAFLYLENSM